MISIKTQKKLMFIPFVNAAVLPIYYLNSLKRNVPFLKTLKGIALAAVWSFPVAAVRMALHILLPDAAAYADWFLSYLTFVVMCFALIRYQEKLGFY